MEIRTITVILALFLFSSLAFSATIYVPDNYPTIQDAINGSVNGDTVIVRPGTYVENVGLVGKTITARGRTLFFKPDRKIYRTAAA